ncbi:MAG: thiamine phosphate synthase, partial [Nitrospira sp.]|nr:thiamine phosphate synthase [Nitrospira sp.]
DIALAIDADGVHLGQKSMPAHAVKKIAKERLLIGVSTHSLEEAMDAEEGGADFITLGPLYETPSKFKYGAPIGIDALSRIKPNVSLPVLGIGGIKLDNIKEVMDAGADGVTLISGILAAANIRETTEAFLRSLK